MSSNSKWINYLSGTNASTSWPHHALYVHTLHSQFSFAPHSTVAVQNWATCLVLDSIHAEITDQFYLYTVLHVSISAWTCIALYEVLPQSHVLDNRPNTGVQMTLYRTDCKIICWLYHDGGKYLGTIWF